MLTLYSILQLPHTLLRNVEARSRHSERPTLFQKSEDYLCFAWREFGARVCPSVAMTALAVSIARVVKIVSEKKMGRTNALRVVAFVEYEFADRDTAVGNDPGHPMSLALMASEVKGSVTVRESSGLPQPTTVLFYFSEESLFETHKATIPYPIGLRYAD